jgi:hypothetical protein
MPLAIGLVNVRKVMRICSLTLKRAAQSKVVRMMVPDQGESRAEVNPKIEV